jgi:hypothetical protein
MSGLSYTIESVIRRSPEDVFDYCSDLRNELEWNPNVKYVEKLTDGPVGVGTSYRARWSNSGPTTVEVVQFDRPRMWASHSATRGMDILFRGTVTDAASGARYIARLELEPWGIVRLFAPLALLSMRWQDQKNMRHIKQALEWSAARVD